VCFPTAAQARNQTAGAATNESAPRYFMVRLAFRRFEGRLRPRQEKA
jgi:hypothetical protein